MKPNFFTDYFKSISSVVATGDSVKLLDAAKLILDQSKIGGKIILVGNGGSAAMASHVSVDFTKAAQIRAINFNEADLITCFANDYGYDKWVVEALKAYANSSDVIIFISSSGRSPNIINGAEFAKKNGLKVITLSGFDSQNPLRQIADIEFWADSKSYNYVEMTHHIWLLSIVDYIIESKNNYLKSNGALL